ncbi:alpha,alpha-trehalase TreA [Biostraticola tofi]|uniref:Periplasmic trehalase n=1 Tax=Biostraticola tofi TaxID=466109 RepID=A0A4R3YRW5_9GAMM|nr:alpha,alpha-trehalase TreA [Biostraticola tofi]TCV95200.1 alpha,alpha-trehalase [Biostraticola tofi]
MPERHYKGLRVAVFAIALALGTSPLLPASAAGQTASQATVNLQASAPLPPDQTLGPLFNDVQLAKLFPDQKTFADAIPRQAPEQILADYLQQKQQPGFSLKKFTESRFILPQEAEPYIPPAGQTLRQHIDGLWQVLSRKTDRVEPHDSLLPLPNSYVVPGGRFREVYYWDSYFTMLGLAESGNWQQVRNMTDNFAYQISQYGHIPNGNRSYYLSRSQPPFFSFMVSLLATHEGDEALKRYQAPLKKEYDYWMAGSNGLAKNTARHRVVRLSDGSLLNRYWDERDTPRTESWLEDITTARQAAGRAAADVYRDLRAGAASGWDFSSRWLRDPHDLSSIRTTAIIPVDLNALLYHLERTLARASTVAGQPAEAGRYSQLADGRMTAVNRLLWNDQQGYYTDFDWQLDKQTAPVTAATLFPLYVQMAPRERAVRTGETVRRLLLKEGGLSTTTVHNGQQWDAPNGWAPLQWVAVEGLGHYGQDALAQAIGSRFLTSVQALYEAEHKLVEKYAVEGEQLGGGGGGEYALQDGFGWTNGVTLMLMDKYCAVVAGCQAKEAETAD